MLAVLMLAFCCIAFAESSGDPCNAEVALAMSVASPVYLEACGTSFNDETALLAAECHTTTPHDGSPVCAALRRGWQHAARTLLPYASGRGQTRIRHFAEHRRREANAVVQLLQGDAHTKAAVIVPACQWAQNASVIAVMVRFSPKKHGPVSVASVEEPRVLLTEKHLSFTASGRSVNGGKRLRFELELPLGAVAMPRTRQPNRIVRYPFALPCVQRTRSMWRRLVGKRRQEAVA